MQLKIARLINGETVVGEYVEAPNENLGGLKKALAIRVGMDAQGQARGIAVGPPFDPLDKDPVDIPSDKIMYFGKPDSQLASAYMQAVTGLVTPTSDIDMKSIADTIMRDKT